MSASSTGGRGAVPALFSEPGQGQGGWDEGQALPEGRGVADERQGLPERRGVPEEGRELFEERAAPDVGRGPAERLGAPGEERLARAALTRLVEPGDETVGRWLRRMGPVALWRALTGKGKPPPGATGERLAGCALRAAGVDPVADLALIARCGGRFICPGDLDWPGQLDDLGDARPVGLWVRGRADLRMWALRSVAVVGARACSDYGAHVAASLGTGLAERGWVVVSGAAHGVDGAAHRGVLAVGGATIAVLASGVDVPYPRAHTELIERIAEQGLVLAELPPGAHPTRPRFVLRNRVIAALTRGTVVVEAQYRSGSLVTARRAQQLGRSTMGVPGPVTSGLSAGVHELLRGEAVLVTDAAEVAELIGGIGDLAPERRGPLVERDLLDPVTARVLEALSARGGNHLRDVARESGTGCDEALGRLHELLALGFVERHGDRWELVPPLHRSDGARRGDPPNRGNRVKGLRR
ncbi:DNA-processing protein DprA [Streptomyces rapamycinicus]|uniref:DNA processing protein DprA n=2 Tax=Streptomyces rapamycinicus TaxID=1226757 RepID=A0A3L8RR86_STRRN|nr:DNA-processing protein DprA [Streptomyces rapamycinicus]MBB4782235.1 DNA processing protein [Streptomyces rapamycinicus]RLV82281.1 DNA processing protein DprA [Streptomyces rapamycinicus NRRL 5491]UTO62763.1 DNA-processing protein DprA [Streptomyces rapamycinicus]UTP30721.1 DNA-processing protein DprA [Streptomyces rapamycinicus NRRL 5491]